MDVWDRIKAEWTARRVIVELYGHAMPRGRGTCGPCPKCGGRDRFHLAAHGKIAACRRCHTAYMGPIDLVLWWEDWPHDRIHFQLVRDKLDGPPQVRGSAASQRRDAYAWAERDATATYDYECPDTGQSYRKFRVEAPGKRKSFPTFRLRDGDWVLSQGGDLPCILYREVEVREAIASGSPIFLCEGEKACDAARDAWGVCTTTHGRGAASWHPSFTPKLRRAQVEVIADLDGPGEEWARKVVQSLSGTAATVRVWQSGTGGEKDDLYDHIVAGLSKTALVRREDLELIATPPSLVYVNHVGFKPITYEYLWTGRLPVGFVALFDGEPGAGKTKFALATGAHLSCGREPWSEVEREPERTLIVGRREDAPEERETVWIANGGLPGFLAHHDVEFKFDHDGLCLLANAIRYHRSRYVIVDGLFDFIEGDPNSAVDVSRCLSRVTDLCMDLRLALVICRQEGKSVEDRAVSAGGIGSQMIRAKARSQLVFRFHPDAKAWPGVVLAVDGRGSLLRKRAEPFAWQHMDDNSIQLFHSLPEEDLAAADTGELWRKKSSRAARDRPTVPAIGFVLDILASGPASFQRLLTEASEREIDKRALNQALAELRQTQSISRYRDGNVWSYRMVADEAPSALYD